jgi:hypothetical protein
MSKIGPIATGVQLAERADELDRYETPLRGIALYTGVYELARQNGLPHTRANLIAEMAQRVANV